MTLPELETALAQAGLLGEYLESQRIHGEAFVRINQDGSMQVVNPMNVILKNEA